MRTLLADVLHIVPLGLLILVSLSASAQDAVPVQDTAPVAEAASVTPTAPLSTEKPSSAAEAAQENSGNSGAPQGCDSVSAGSVSRVCGDRI